MSDFARLMEMALAGGATPEDITGRAPPPLAEQLAEAEKAAAKAAPAGLRADRDHEHRETREKK